MPTDRFVGPVFVYDWITAARRWQVYALRSAFVLFLLGALVVMWKTAGHPSGFSIRAMAELGQSFYLGVAGTQLALVMLAAPAATAGAICLDRARGTLTHLLMTDLSSTEIVLGKLAARLLPVLTLLACTLPMMELLTLLGGVDPEMLWKSFIVSVAMAVLGCSLAMLCSLWVDKTHEALLLTYAVWLLWLLAGPMFSMLAWSVGWSLTAPPRTADPFYLVLAPLWYPKSASWGDYVWFLVVTCCVSAIFALLAIARIRAVCTTETVRKPSRALAAARNRSIWKLLSRNVPWLSPSLDRNPVIWREWNRSRPSRWASVVIAIYLILSLSFSVLAVCETGGRSAIFVNGLQVAIGLLLLSVTAATSLAEERVRGSLDLLMSTSLSTREIVLGKWLGVYRTVPLLAILPTFVIGTLSFERDAGPWWAVRMFIYVLCAGAAVTSLGLALATRLSRLGQAVGTTVSLYVVFTVGWFFLMLLMYAGWGERPAMLSPFMFSAELAYEVQETRVVVNHTGWAMLSTAVAAWFALELLLSTLGGFDRRLGRIPDRTTTLLGRSITMRILSVIYLVLSLFMAFESVGNYYASLGATFQFALATFLAAASGASSPKPDRAIAGTLRGGDDAFLESSSGGVIMMKWLAAVRIMLPGMILAWLMVAVWFDRVVGTYSSTWRNIPVAIAYMLSTGAFAASLGVALWARIKRGVWAVLVTLAVWTFLNAAGLTFAWAVPGETLGRGLSMSSPYFGFWTLILAVNTNPGDQFETMHWAMFWIVFYAIVAVGLLRASRR